MNFSTSSKSKSKSEEVSTHSSLPNTQPPRLEVQIPTPITPQVNIQQGPTFSFSPALPSASQASIQQGLNMLALHLHLHLGQVICFIKFHE